MLCVLLGHALLVWALRDLTRPQLEPAREEAPFISQMFFFEDEDIVAHAEVPPPQTAAPAQLPLPPVPDPSAADADAQPGESTAIASPEARGYIDWPQERRDAAARVLAAEAEAERIAKMFAGPQGTWASLTQRQQSELAQFRWRPGVDGLERDERGNTIYRISDRCVLVNFLFIGCSLGAKPPAYGDLFKDMRLYFDEQRLPRTNEGNGREPESLRPPKWSKPLGVRDP
jgi:hypothetical protein